MQRAKKACFKYKCLLIALFLQIFYAEPPKGAEHKELPKEAPKNLRPLLHPHMNIVYITILLEAMSETIPSRLDFLKSKLNNKKGWPQPAILLRSV